MSMDVFVLRAPVGVLLGALYALFSDGRAVGLPVRL